MSDTKLLATMTGLSEAQVAREASRLVETKGGKISELARLDAWLLRTQQGANTKTVDAFQALAAAAIEAHPMEDVSHAFNRGAGSAGYPTTEPTKMGPDVGTHLEKAAREASHKVEMSALAFEAASSTGARGFTASTGSKTGQAFPQNTLPAGAPELDQQQGKLDADSKSLMFEKLKDEMQKISQMNEMILNVYAAMHEQGMTALRNVKA